jgi:hypothetical protein
VAEHCVELDAVGDEVSFHLLSGTDCNFRNHVSEKERIESVGTLGELERRVSHV